MWGGRTSCRVLAASLGATGTASTAAHNRVQPSTCLLARIAGLSTRAMSEAHSRIQPIEGYERKIGSDVCTTTAMEYRDLYYEGYEGDASNSRIRNSHIQPKERPLERSVGTQGSRLSSASRVLQPLARGSRAYEFSNHELSSAILHS